MHATQCGYKQEHMLSEQSNSNHSSKVTVVFSMPIAQPDWLQQMKLHHTNLQCVTSPVTSPNHQKAGAYVTLTNLQCVTSPNHQKAGAYVFLAYYFWTSVVIVFY